MPGCSGFRVQGANDSGFEVLGGRDVRDWLRKFMVEEFRGRGGGARVILIHFDTMMNI